MHIILTVDDNWGTRFNNRRQSRDKALIERILELTSYATLWIHESSAKLFPAHAENLSIDVSFPSQADSGDFCFVEDLSLMTNENMIDDIIIFHWNRHYHSDQVFDRAILENGWTLINTSEFAGNSHEKITEEWYTRKQES